MNYYIQSISSISPQPTFGTDDFLASTVEATNSLSLQAVEPDYKNFITDANLRRRMSRIVKMGVSAALDCVNNSLIDNPDAIITATGLGCLADTEKFMNAIIDNDEQLLNPTGFIQSTFNTIGAQIALILKNHNYNFTYVHRGFSFESALIDALMQLEDEEAQSVLVGAIDEITPTSRHIMQRMGFWHGGAKMGEGAQFFMLSSQPSKKDFAKINDVFTFQLSDKKNNTTEHINSFLKKNGINPNDIDLILTGDTGDKSQDIHYQNLKSDIFKQTPSASFKNICGEYQTASSFGMWCAANILKRQQIPAVLNSSTTPKGINRILLYNVYRNTNHSLILLEKA